MGVFRVKPLKEESRMKRPNQKDMAPSPGIDIKAQWKRVQLVLWLSFFNVVKLNLGEVKVEAMLVSSDQ